jgi:hypothetical protein
MIKKKIKIKKNEFVFTSLYIYGKYTMKIIMTVLDGGSNPLYTEMREIWNLFRKCGEPNVYVYFLRYSDDKTLFPKDEKYYLDEATATLYQYGVETVIPGILEKTRGAMEYFCTTCDFDYFYRTNLSSIFDFDTMLEYLEKNPTEYGGKLENAFDQYWFASGSGYVLSRSACDTFLEHYDEMLSDLTLFDDVTVGKIMQKYVKMSYIPRVTFSYTDDPDILNILEDNFKEIYHYRCLSDSEHIKTIYYMQQIYKKIYLS